MWEGYDNNAHLTGDYLVSDNDGTIIFRATLEYDLKYMQSIYLITEEATGLMYIGQAKRAFRRMSSHRCNIISAIRVLLIKAQGKKANFNVSTLPFHIKLAMLYIETGRLELRCTILSSFEKRLPLKKMYKEEFNLLRQYVEKYPNKILNVNLPKKEKDGKIIPLGSSENVTTNP